MSRKSAIALVVVVVVALAVWGGGGKWCLAQDATLGAKPMFLVCWQHRWLEGAAPILRMYAKSLN